jgi:hypothetical protein
VIVRLFVRSFVVCLLVCLFVGLLAYLFVCLFVFDVGKLCEVWTSSGSTCLASGPCLHAAAFKNKQTSKQTNKQTNKQHSNTVAPCSASPGSRASAQAVMVGDKIVDVNSKTDQFSMALECQNSQMLRRVLTWEQTVSSWAAPTIISLRENVWRPRYGYQTDTLVYFCWKFAVTSLASLQASLQFLLIRRSIEDIKQTNKQTNKQINKDIKAET